MAQKFPKDIQKAVDQIEALRKQVTGAVKAATRDSGAAKELQSRMKDLEARFGKETKGTPVLRNLLDIAKQMGEALAKAQTQFTVEIERADRDEAGKRMFSELCNAVRALGNLKGNPVLHQRMSGEVTTMKDSYERANKERDHGRAGDQFMAMERPMKELLGRLRDAAKVADVVDGAVEAMFKRTQAGIDAILAGGGVRSVFASEMADVRAALAKASAQLNANAAKSAVADRLKKMEMQAFRIQDIWARSRDMLMAIDKGLKAAGSPKDLMQWFAALEKGRYDWSKYKSPRDMVLNVEAWWQDLGALADTVKRETAKT
ncbi:MAG: hypothetical protein ACKVQR_20560 [Aquabacterium sp.]